MENKLLTITAAAERSGIAPHRLRRAIRAGRLPAKNVGTGPRAYYRVSTADLAAYVAALPQAPHRA